MAQSVNTSNMLQESSRGLHQLTVWFGPSSSPLQVPNMLFFILKKLDWSEASSGFVDSQGPLMEAWGPVGNSKSIRNLKETVPFSTLEPSILTDMCRCSCVGFNDYQCNSVTLSRAPGAGLWVPVGDMKCFQRLCD